MSVSLYKTKIKQKGLKLNWVAMQISVSRPTLSAYLSGIRTMPLDVEARLKELLR
jgi:predicted transcriptional regulator